MSVGHVFIDLGCHSGDTVEEFRNWSKIAFDRKWQWDIYAFDINPAFIPSWEGKANDRTTFIHKAAWTHDGTIEVAIDKADAALGSTAMPGKKAVWDTGDKITVECFDFSAYLELFKDDYVVVKCDIEGAEFPILEKLLTDGTIKYIDKLLCEFHPNKVVEYTTTDKLDLIKRIEEAGADIYEWH